MCFATINYPPHPTSDPNTDLSNPVEYFASLPQFGDTSFQYGLDEHQVQALRHRPKSLNLKSHNVFNNSNLLSCVDSGNYEHSSTQDFNGLNASPETIDSWLVDWNYQSSHPLPGGLDPFPFDDTSLLSIVPSEADAESQLDTSLSPPVDDVSSIDVLHPDIDLFLTNLDGNPAYNNHDLSLYYFLALSTSPSTALSIPGSTDSQMSGAMSSNESSSIIQGPNLDPGSILQSIILNSEPIAAATKTTPPIASPKAINEIKCTWPTCTKSFPTRSAYK